MPKSARGKKYAAKLLYQYEAVNPRLRGQRRLCEESTILIHARSAKEALRRAKRHARGRYFTFRTVNGLKVGFQFVGDLERRPRSAAQLAVAVGRTGRSLRSLSVRR